jgi:DNA (cytosine-5)-methyltransferase 1
VVLGDLAALGYDARWGIVGAHHVGAPHERLRLWLVGSNSESFNGDSRDCMVQGRERTASQPVGGFSSLAASTRGGAESVWFQCEPRLERLANGVAHRPHRLKAAGNGQVPAVAALAWRLLGGPSDE